LISIEHAERREEAGDKEGRFGLGATEARAHQALRRDFRREP